jgi:hypothetical protein
MFPAPRLCLQRITFAKTKSDAVAKQDGSFQERDVEMRKQMNREARGAARLPLPSPCKALATCAYPLPWCTASVLVFKT